MTERPRRQSALGVYLARFLFFDEFYIAIQILAGLTDLFFFPLWGVCVHKRQADIRLRHDERKGAVQMQSLLPKVFIQHLHCSSDAVAAGHERIDEGRWLKDDVRAPYELSDDMGWLPAVNGEAETQSLAFLQLIPALALF